MTTFFCGLQLTKLLLCHYIIGTALAILYPLSEKLQKIWEWPGNEAILEDSCRWLADRSDACQYKFHVQWTRHNVV